ncbi:tRNA (adenosine(37)-N6)-threonylcarbamoyltransferase complex ATPase subunit type 1 TsaE [Desulfovibrio piger]|uniref:tRNA (adenosine(37)-N6)-threonylcarbamoyltransferase complex ATPase subunit type 1 TsaE n=1 Tax=Desulfovibrio piger TaxID=901 RepID=UPI0026E9C806|nr:tRNA (adenosine(37)-N6)-threonylcarbamoyltransferase complex ATPase subunit type 1 TsaE [Desulfovibrio piger]
MDAFTFLLESLDDTACLGTLLADMMQSTPQVRALLLQGDLGSGKTTLARSFVAALPGGGQAEISSPSFTICNEYPTCPPVLHCDLYRCPASLPDEVWDALDADAGICIVEWAQYIPEAALPKEFLDIRLDSCEKGRFLTVMAHGQASQALAQELHTAWTASGRHGSRTELPLFS